MAKSTKRPAVPPPSPRHHTDPPSPGPSDELDEEGSAQGIDEVDDGPTGPADLNDGPLGDGDPDDADLEVAADNAARLKALRAARADDDVEEQEKEKKAAEVREMRRRVGQGPRSLLKAHAAGRPLPKPAPAPTRFRPTDAQQIHATQLLPEMFPYESETHPGVWIDPISKKPVAPRVRTGGQFAARLLLIENVHTSDLREIGLPMAISPDNWGVEDHERVTKHVELIFDFEDDRDKFLKRYGIQPWDPLRRNEEGGVGTNPGLLGPKMARQPLG